MRDSLRKLPAPGEPQRTKQPRKVGRGFEMKGTRDRGRRSARGPSPSARQEQPKRSSEPSVDRPSSRKRTRGGGLTRHQTDPSPSRSLSTNRKRPRRSIEEDKLASSTTRPDKVTSTGTQAAARPSSSSRKVRVQRRAGGLAAAPRPSSLRIGERRASSRAAAVSSVSPPGEESEAPAPAAAPAVTTAAIGAPPSWTQQQKPQRQTRKRPVDPDKPMKIFIVEDSSGGGGSNISSSSNTSRAKNTSAEYGQAVQTLETFARGRNGCKNNATATMANGSTRASAASSRSNGSTASSSSRRHGARCSAARARGGAASPGRAASCAATTATASAAQQAPKATVPGGPSGVESFAKDNVICPQFRLHNLFGATAAGNGEKEGRRASGTTSSLGSRRRRPVKTTAASASGAGSMAPPRRGASARGREAGFLEQTKDALVRCTHAVLGRDYDMDDEDSAFLEQLNSSGGRASVSPRGVGSTARGSAGHSGGNGPDIRADMFEAMIERLERQESRARDTMVLVEASLRLKEEHEDAAERVDQFIKEGDAVLNFAAGIPEDDDSGGGGISMGNGSSSGGHANGHGKGGGGGSNRRRKKQAGYAQEDDSDSDDGEHQARIMRTRGPVTLTEAFALPLLRSCVAASLSSPQEDATADAAGSDGTRARETASKAKGWKGKGKQRASRRGRSSGEEEEEEEEETEAGGASDEQLLAVFRYWAQKREGYGGPMLRCFHPFIMRLWRRMEDPAREAEDQEEGRDPHASPEAFDTLKSFRQDLDKARLVVDCVKRREKLKRSVIRFANAYWKILDDTMDAPRARAPKSSKPKPAAPPPTLQPSSRPSTRMAVRATKGRIKAGASGAAARAGGGGRSSGRAAAAAARAAVTALATAEARETEDQYEVAAGHDDEEGEEEEVEDVPPPPPPPPAASKSKGKAAGLAEQEQGWNAFAQLPAREGGIPPPGAVLRLRQRKKGAATERGKKGDRRRAAVNAANPMRGLFVHRGVLPGGGHAGGGSGDNCQQGSASSRQPRAKGVQADVVEKETAKPSQHRRPNCPKRAPAPQEAERAAAAEAGAPVASAEEPNERARRRERFNAASRAALAQQQQRSKLRQQQQQQASGRHRRRGHRLREPKSEEVEADEGDVKEAEAPAALGRSGRRGGTGNGSGTGGSVGRGRGRPKSHQPESEGKEPEQPKPNRSNATKRRRRLESEPEDTSMEEEASGTNANKRRKTSARGSKSKSGSGRGSSPPAETEDPPSRGGTKHRRLEENSNLENAALVSGRQKQDAASTHASVASKRLKTRASRSVAAVVVVDEAPAPPKAALVLPLPGRKGIKPTARGRNKSSRGTGDGRGGNRALACLS